MNRKLIRTTLAEVKGRETTPQARETSERAAPPPRAAQHRPSGGGGRGRAGRRRLPRLARGGPAGGAVLRGARRGRGPL